MDGVWSGLVAALVGGAAGYVSALLTNVIERRKVIDESVRAVRSKRYAELWRSMALLPRWPRATEVTYGQLDDYSKTLRAWYFGVDEAGGEPGGMYLSSASRRQYGRLQESLSGRVAAGEGTVTDADYDELQRRASALRTAMTGDLLSRRRAFMTR